MIMCIPSLFPYNDKYLQNLKWVSIRILKGDYKACLFLVMITHDESLLTQENKIFSCFGGYIYAILQPLTNITKCTSINLSK